MSLFKSTLALLSLLTWTTHQYAIAFTLSGRNSPNRFHSQSYSKIAHYLPGNVEERKRCMTILHQRIDRHTDDHPDQTSLPLFLQQQNIDDKLSQVICAAARACADISQELSRLPISSSRQSNQKSPKGGETNVQGEVQKPMDVIANDIFIHEVIDYVGVMASEEEEHVIEGKLMDFDRINAYEIAFDPLDGSSNLDVSVPTGTIFGIAPFSSEKKSPFTSSGRSLCAAGYAVYSSSVELVISLGQSGELGAHGFTLDPLLKSEEGKDYDFILTRPNMLCQEMGAFYSLNDGREPDWPDGLKRWVHDAKRGKTPSATVYSSRYICSLCADFHRTLIKGGWCGNPRPHLRLLYEAAPLSHIAEACGGRGSDGQTDLLDILPNGLHDRTPVFIGSIRDIDELVSYGDIQQGAKSYGN